MIPKIDADSHFLHPKVFQYVSDSNQSKIPKFEFSQDGKLLDVTYLVDPSPFHMQTKPPTTHNRFLGLSNIEERINDFSKLGINFQILNPQELAMRFTVLTDKKLAVDMAYSYNRTILEIVKQHPTKFAANLLIVQQDPDWSMKEIKWGKENGFNSIILDVLWHDGKYTPGLPVVLSPKFEEICALCADLDMVMYFHNNPHRIGFFTYDLYEKLHLQHFFPSNYQVTLVSLITSNILDKFPNLKIVMSEGLMHFIIPTYEYLKRNTDYQIMKYFNNNFYFTVETEQKEKLNQCINLFGAERFLFATDYPHDDFGGENKFEDHKNIDEDSVISDLDKEKICYKNAKTLFKINLD